MREQPVSLRAWIRRDLTTRYGTIVSEDVPQSMLELLRPIPQQD